MSPRKHRKGVTATTTTTIDNASDVSSFNAPSPTTTTTTPLLLHQIPSSRPRRRSSGEDKSGPPPGPLTESLFLSATLTILHLTMTVLVHNQYAQALDVPSILRSGPVWAAFPLLMCIIYPVHYLKAEAATAYTDALVELGLLVLSLVVGAQLVGVVSDRPYLAVMKRAPALGTVWVWTVVEVSWFTGVVGLLGVAGWAWKRGHWA